MQDREFKLKPSKLHCIGFSILWISSLLIILCLPISLMISVSGAFLFCVYSAYQFWRTLLLKHRESIISLRSLSDGNWLLNLANKEEKGILRGDSTITPFVAVLRFQIDNRRLPLTCLVFKDSLERDQYRQLLVIVKN